MKRITKIKKKNEDEYAEDLFDCTLPINRLTDVCVLCKQGHAFGVSLNKKFQLSQEIDDEDEDNDVQLSRATGLLVDANVWASQYSLAGGKRQFVHNLCALYSPRTWFSGEKWHNLKREIARSSLVCKRCNKRGATLGCHETRCNVTMHIPCAFDDGFSPSQISANHDYYCSEHVAKRKQEQLILDAEVVGDISFGREPVPVSIDRNVDISSFPKGFEYFTRNLDSYDVTSTVQNVRDLICCACEGLCNDVTKCKCLRIQKNYTMKGTLIPGSDQPILECNMRCSCSIRECTNRVVEKGSRVQLELFKREREHSSPSSSSRSTKDWGVRTVNDIPQGSFICEMVGQYVLGESVITYFTKDGSIQGGKPVVDSLLEHGSGDPLVAVINTWELPKNVTPQIFASNMLKVENRPNYVISQSSLESTTSLIPRKRSIEDAPTSAQKKSLIAPNAFEMVESDKSSEMNAIHSLEQYETDLTTLSEETNTLRSDETADIMDFLRGQRCIDSRFFGNIARFIARSSQRGRCSFSKPQMVTRRLVYCNQTGENDQGDPKQPSEIDLGLPKLALFANVDICAGSEIIM